MSDALVSRWSDGANPHPGGCHSSLPAGGRMRQRIRKADASRNWSITLRGCSSQVRSKPGTRSANADQPTGHITRYQLSPRRCLSVWHRTPCSSHNLFGSTISRSPIVGSLSNIMSPTLPRGSGPCWQNCRQCSAHPTARPSPWSRPSRHQQKGGQNCESYCKQLSASCRWRNITMRA